MLPEPWLPLKKGQSLVNLDHRGETSRVSKDNEAVVLTLRKRRSSVRRSSSVPRAGPSTSEGTQADASADAAVVRNPWEDSHSRSVQNGHTINHRLSFDVASGVIMLPENETWIDDAMDSDDDYENENTGALEQSITEASGAGDGEPLTSPPSSPSRSSRYGTYFHHPERRRQVIPGAFPGR